MTKILILILVLILGAVVIYYNFIDTEVEIRSYEILRSNCIELQIGMTKSEVLEVMGEPLREYYQEIDIMKVDKWIYDNNSFNSTPIYCWFDSTSGKLMYKVCGE